MEISILRPAEIEHVIATIFQPGGQSEISAQAETHHVMRLLNQKHTKSKIKYKGTFQIRVTVKPTIKSTTAAIKL